ncbi:EF-hand [Martensiomyces pterosporus]|nr:EF-hand [Martensiomyces pterosporus]
MGGGIGNLTHEQREELQELFETLDSAGRGYIPVSKLASVVDALGLGTPTQDTLDSWMVQVDPGKTGRIDYLRLEEFISLRYDEADQRQEMLNAFRLFKPDARDVDREEITFDDLKRVSAHLGEHIPDDELKEMINIADMDGTGKVNFADFMRVMRKTGLF